MTPYKAERERRIKAAVYSPAVEHPCKNGHSISNVGGWLICSRCGVNLGKA